MTVFERLRGSRAAIRNGKPFDEHLSRFQALAATCRVLPVDGVVADHAAILWAAVSKRAHRALGDVLMAATASAFGLPLVTRNQRDFTPMTQIAGVQVTLDFDRLESVTTFQQGGAAMSIFICWSGETSTLA